MSEEVKNASLHGHATLTDQVQGEPEAAKRTAEVSMRRIVTHVLSDIGSEVEANLFCLGDIVAQRYEVKRLLVKG